MVKKLRVSLALQAIATALFASSPFTEGSAQRFQVAAQRGLARYRSQTVPDCSPSCSKTAWVIERYVDYALDVPMYFVYRDGELYRCRRRIVSRNFWRGELAPAAGRKADPGRLVGPPNDIVSRKCASSASWRCVVATVDRGDGSVRCRHSGLGCSTIKVRSMRPGTWSRTGPPKSVSDVCAMPCRAQRPRMHHFDPATALAIAKERGQNISAPTG